MLLLGQGVGDRFERGSTIDHRLHRSLDASAPFRFVDIARWESADAWRAAHDEGFRALVSRPEWRDFVSTPGLYDAAPVHAGAAPVVTEA